MSSILSGKKVLVTGATGFIGGRLIEKLIFEHGARPQALVNNFMHASRLARFDLEMIGGGLHKAEAVDRAVAGCEVVFNCAHDFNSVPRNLDGARLLAEACLRHRARRLVHISSISVYQPLRGTGENLDETAPSEMCGWGYPDSKLAVERELLDYGSKHGLPVTVLQPTIVYGPYSRPWTLGPAKNLRAGRVVLPADGEGVCNAVYVDDVADAVMLAAQKDAAVGERFLISGPDAVSWHEFYALFERILGTQSVVLMPTAEIERLNRRDGITPQLGALRHDPRRLLNWQPVRRLYKFVRQRAGDKLRKQVRQAMPQPLYAPDPERLDIFQSRAVVRSEKARRLLGFEPAFDFKRGMQLTEQFMKWANL
jgi:nucleoside-diphosphate-sugar epimerase